MLLDRTYFTGGLSLPQLTTEQGVGVGRITQIVGERSLEWFIAIYEPEFLNNLLGHRLAEAFTEGLKAVAPLQIWLDLRDKIYTRVGGVKFSPAANYVYFHAMRHSYSQTAMVGEIKYKPSHAVNMDAAFKIVKAWNDMRDPIFSIHQFVKDNWSDYKSFADGFPCDRWFRPINTLGI